jgi:hypothetical protein
MNKLTAASSVLLAAICFAGTSLADDYTPYHPDISRELSVNNHLRVAPGISFGVPVGASFDITVHPFVDWLQLEGSVTYNYVAVGYKFGAIWDPINMLWPDSGVGLFADLQYGVSPMGSIPGVDNAPSVSYSYTNFYGGLRLGNAKGFHWDIELGPSWINFNTSNFQSFVNSNNSNNNVKVADPTVSAFASPTFLTGFSIPITF